MFKTAARCLLALLVFTVLFYWIADVGKLSLQRPFEYSGDALEMLSYQTHDYIANDFSTRMRAPFEAARNPNSRYVYNALFQSNSNLTWIARILGGGGAAKTLNLVYLLSFLLVFISSYWVGGRIGLRDPFRFCAASLYALMPYHFQRGEHHLLESCYYFVPLMALVILRLWSARPLACRWQGDHWQFTWRDRRVWFALFLLAFLTSCNPYHQFFFACLAASAAPFAAVYRNSWRPLLAGWGLAVFACAILLLKHGLAQHMAVPESALALNGQAISDYGGAETYPLKLTQLLLPVEGHRWDVLAALRRMYDVANPLNNENSTTTLGFVGSVGFLACMALALVPKNRLRSSLAGKMGLIVLMAVLFGSMGGFGSLVSTISMELQGPGAMLAQARGWDRIAIFIGFFAYVAAFWLLQEWTRKFVPRIVGGPKRVFAMWMVAIAVFAFALWDQVPLAISQQQDGHYRSDVRFFGDIERQLPPDSRIFQLPYVVHHFSGWVLPKIYYTEQLRPYITTRNLHFTYGGDLGSIQVGWLHAASELPASEAAGYLCRYGFAGVLIQRNMLADPSALEAQWARVLGQTPKISADANYSFFDLRPYCAAHGVRILDLAALKAGLLAQLKRGERFVPAGALEHRIGHPFLQPDGNIALRANADASGWLAFGPYGRLQPGHYRAIFEFESVVNGEGSLTLDIAAKALGKHRVLSTTTFQPQSTSGSLHKSLDFTVARGDSNLEYRVSKAAGISLDFAGVKIQRVDH